MAENIGDRYRQTRIEGQRERQKRLSPGELYALRRDGVIPREPIEIPSIRTNRTVRMRSPRTHEYLGLPDYEYEIPDVMGSEQLEKILDPQQDAAPMFRKDANIYAGKKKNTYGLEFGAGATGLLVGTKFLDRYDVANIKRHNRGLEVATRTLRGIKSPVPLEVALPERKVFPRFHRAGRFGRGLALTAAAIAGGSAGWKAGEDMGLGLTGQIAAGSLPYYTYQASRALSGKPVHNFNLTRKLLKTVKLARAARALAPIAAGTAPTPMTLVGIAAAYGLSIPVEKFITKLLLSPEENESLREATSSKVRKHSSNVENYFD